MRRISKIKFIKRGSNDPDFLYRAIKNILKDHCNCNITNIFKYKYLTCSGQRKLVFGIEYEFIEYDL